MTRALAFNRQGATRLLQHLDPVAVDVPGGHGERNPGVPQAAIADQRADGSLDWTPPSGQWLVLRMGYSLLGITNHPASREGTGLEVDKLNQEHVKAYFNA